MATHTKRVDVDARFVEESGEQIVTPNGIVSLQSGQVVVNDSGHVYVMDREEFDEEFSAVEEKENTATKAARSPRKPANG